MKVHSTAHIWVFNKAVWPLGRRKRELSEGDCRCARGRRGGRGRGVRRGGPTLTSLLIQCLTVYGFMFPLPNTPMVPALCTVSPGNGRSPHLHFYRRRYS